LIQYCFKKQKESLVINSVLQSGNVLTNLSLKFVT